MKKTQGSVLLVSLVLLLIMTIAGLTAIRMTSLEEKMSGNYLNQQMAFNAAEVALLEAESWINSSTPDLNSFTSDCADGFCFNGSDAVDITVCEAGNDRPWLDSDTWSNSASHQVVNLVVEGISARAKYIIEFRCYLAKESNGILPDPASAEDWAMLFRITALATGGSSDARVMLQSTFKKNS